MTSTETHTYSRGAIIFQAAAESFGVQLADEQNAEWQSLIKTAFILDNILDSDLPQVEREETFDKSVPELIYPIAEDWDTVKLDRVVSAAMNVKEIAGEKRATTSAKKLGNLALYEGLETKRFLQLQDSDDLGVTNFNAWLEYLLTFGVVVDTVVDLPEDYSNGLTMVEPSVINRSIIAAYGLRKASRLIATTPASLFVPLSKAARAVTDDSFKDKLNNT